MTPQKQAIMMRDFPLIGGRLFLLDGFHSLSIFIFRNRLKKFIEHYRSAILRILTLV